MGVTKNAIVGKAHRLDLPARPSPIRKQPTAGAAPTAAAPRRRDKPAVPTSVIPARTAAPVVGGTPPRPQQAQPRPATLPPSAPAAAAAAPARVSHFPRASLRSCCWPIGEPGTREFSFCGAEADPGRPYCAHHAAIAYVRVRDRRSDAA
jgi:GcrA cell cycle regulator